MVWGNPFSFAGRIGRGQLWLTLIVAGLVGIIPEALPVTTHKVVLSTFGGFGESSISYVTPAEPVTVKSWLVLFVFYVSESVIYWIAASAIVRRLHDLERSGKWLAIIFGTAAIVLTIEAISPHLGAPLVIVDTVVMALLVPVGATMVWGMFELLWMPGRQ